MERDMKTEKYSKTPGEKTVSQTAESVRKRGIEVFVVENKVYDFGKLKDII